MLEAFEVMFNFVVVAASGKDLLELPILCERYGAGFLREVEEPFGVSGWGCGTR